MKFSNAMNKNIFKNTVIDNFHFLQEKYGFSAPIAEDFGREIYIRFNRASQTVSISWEFGGSPLIEIFYPPDEINEKSVPWASKNGIQRNRRFPKIKPSIHFSDEEDVIKIYVKEMSFEFQKMELSWLTQNAS